MNLTAKPLRYATSKEKITPAEAKSAIYLDYEGNKDKAPTLLGWAVSGTYKAAIVEPLLRRVLTATVLKAFMQKIMQTWSCA